MKKPIALILVVLALALLVVLVACDNQTPGTDTTDGTTDTTTARIDVNYITIIAADGTTEYQLVRSDTASADLVTEISEFYKTLSTKYGVSYLSFRYTSDWLKSGDTPPAKEILVGETNREETKQVLEGLQEFDYAIVMVGSKLVICGGSDEATLQAMAIHRKYYDQIRSSCLKFQLYLHLSPAVICILYELLLLRGCIYPHAGNQLCLQPRR